MPLVEYPASESEAEDEPTNPPKRRKTTTQTPKHNHTLIPPPPLAPSLPSSFSSLYTVPVRSTQTDTADLHEGRVRQTPHKAGNWPAFIYLEWTPTRQIYNVLDQIIAEVQVQEHEHKTASASNLPTTIKSSLTSNTGVRLPLHISLSAPLTLSTATKDRFRAAVESATSGCGVPAFNVQVEKLKWVSNFERTRWFLVLVLRANEALDGLLSVCNAACIGNGLPVLYARGNPSVGVDTGRGVGLGLQKSRTDLAVDVDVDADRVGDEKVFHFSIAWCLAEPGLGMDDAELALRDIDLEELTGLHIEIKHVYLKIGSDVVTMPLE